MGPNSPHETRYGEPYWRVWGSGKLPKTRCVLTTRKIIVSLKLPSEPRQATVLTKEAKSFPQRPSRGVAPTAWQIHIGRSTGQGIGRLVKKKKKRHRLGAWVRDRRPCKCLQQLKTPKLRAQHPAGRQQAAKQFPASTGTLNVTIPTYQEMKSPENT